ncbi:MAG: hypothetical protein IPH13_20380 [Planctomycetes bacterium]|nr:hypothetical protein [Planctomycetota bacterium]
MSRAGIGPSLRPSGYHRITHHHARPTGSRTPDRLRSASPR